MKRASVALIDESRCIGCVRCIDACPVDAIVGAQAQVHTVVEPWCIGCDLCVPACPVDCIDMVQPQGPWSEALKRAAGNRARLKRKREVTFLSRDRADRRRVLSRILGKKP
jgi:electron transport complex protein RnfB